VNDPYHLSATCKESFTVHFSRVAVQRRSFPLSYHAPPLCLQNSGGWVIRKSRTEGIACKCGLFSLDKICPVYILKSFESCFLVKAVKIRIDDLKNKTVHLSDEEPLEGYPTLLALQEAGESSFLAPLRIDLTIAREYDHIRVNGRVETRMALNCARCLTEFQVNVDSPFTIFYMRAAGMSDDEDVELAEEDLITATYEGDEIDFTAEIAEQIILAIPFKPLCSEDCRGLCPSCGTELNVIECACGRNDVNFKFSPLKNLKIMGKGEIEHGST